MKCKKQYIKPVLNSEKVEIGVFGKYGGSGGSPMQVHSAMFGICKDKEK